MPQRQFNALNYSDPMLVRILDAGEQCILRFGIRRTSMGEVARVGKLSRGSIYRYFGAKEALVEGIIRRQQENFLNRTEAKLENESNLVDKLTSLGNRRYALQRLSDVLRNVESRGGICCVLVLGVQNLEELGRKLGDTVQQELLRGIARRLQQLVRPTDVIARVGDDTFAIVTLAEDPQDCKPASFKRLHDGLNLKAFKTSEGYLSLRAGMALCAVSNKKPLPQAAELLERVEVQLGDAYATNLVTEVRWAAIEA